LLSLTWQVSISRPEAVVKDFILPDYTPELPAV